MKRMALIVLLIVALIGFPQVHAQFGSLSVKGSITVVRGDYSTGSLTLTNSAGVIYSVVTFQSFWVEDSNGNRVEGFNFTMFPRVFPNWGRGQNKSVTYNLTVSKNVLPGNYTLYLRFIATYSGEIYILKARVPITVLASPITFTSAYSYIPGRGDVPHAFLGEHIVVYSRVINIGHFNVTVGVFSGLLHDGDWYSVIKKNVTVPPGETLIKLDLPIEWTYPEGNYTLVYKVSYLNQTYTYTRKLTADLGVRLVGASVERKEVILNDTLRAYVTIISERTANVTVSYVAILNGEKAFDMGSKDVHLSPGTSIVQLNLPTFESGNVSALVSVFVHNILAGNATLQYTIYAPPSIGSLSSKLVNSTLDIQVLLLNPTPDEVKGTLRYDVLANGTSLYSDILEVTIPPGEKKLSFAFEVPKGVNVTYSFKLNALGRVSVKEGSLWIPVPKPKPSPSSASSATTMSESNTTSTTGGTGGGGFPWWPVVGILIIVAVAVVVYYQNQPKKRRTRKAPKRRSPLGRFKRPKPPKFRERDSLPKKK